MNSYEVIKNIIESSLYETKPFDGIIKRIDSYVNGAAHNMAELKDKANDKNKKGNLWETFCLLYIRHIMGHEIGWLYKDFPLKEQFKLPNIDHGIDIISRDANGYYAIQCKYKQPNGKTQIVSWRSLATFYALVEKTGPWVRHITMTNVNGCKHIGEKMPKDLSICIGTFSNLNIFDYLKMIGATNIVISEPKQLSQEELRQKRLEKLDN